MIRIEGTKMSKKRAVYSAEFKTRLVLEVFSQRVIWLSNEAQKFALKSKKKLQFET